MQVPFDFAQGRLSTPLKSASLRMTGSLGAVSGFGAYWTNLETGH
jgi:hypothetical protein